MSARKRRRRKRNERPASEHQARRDRVRAALERAGLDALVCALPANALMVSGYWPVVGTVIAIGTRGGRCAVLVPDDERALAAASTDAELTAFTPASLGALRRAEESVVRPLGALLGALGLAHARVGWEGSAAFEPASYAALHLYGAAMARVLAEAAPDASLHDATAVIAELRAVLTPREVHAMRRACAAAERAYVEGMHCVRADMRETEVANVIRSRLAVVDERDGVRRADGFVYCMAGPDSAEAGAAYARSRARRIAPGDFVLIHGNAYVDGFWTDITRTYCVGAPNMVQEAMYAAVFEARQAALEVIRPGVTGAEVDRAARTTLARLGFADAFTHGTGHGVGFAAIDHDARPRLHPASADVLEPGMIFNVEPALYIAGVGGLRHCDMVLVTDDGAELLTTFHASLDALTL